MRTQHYFTRKALGHLNQGLGKISNIYCLTIESHVHVPMMDYQKSRADLPAGAPIPGFGGPRVQFGGPSVQFGGLSVQFKS